jgi:hypothetical protein
MVIVVVEREFDEPKVFAEFQAVEDANAWCLETNQVTFQRSYFSLDRKRMLCIYEGPDAESVRRAQDQAGLPYTRIYQASVI